MPQHIIVYPISRGTAINITACIVRPDLEKTPFPGPWTSNVNASEVRSLFDDWEPVVTTLLEVRTMFEVDGVDSIYQFYLPVRR